MTALNKYGILPPRSADEPRYQERTTISHQQFCEEAGDFLRRLRPTVIDDSIPRLDSYPAKWQPMGFQIYDLGIFPELGFLRLHVWAKNLRRATQKRDVIHNHSRHIASTILFGVYRDTLFDVQPANVSKPPDGAYTMYEKSINPDQTEILLSTGIAMEVKIAEERVINTASQHFIRPDVFHQTGIPLTETCVTLTFNSFRTIADGPYILLDEPPGRDAVSRQAVTAAEANNVKALFTS